MKRLIFRIRKKKEHNNNNNNGHIRNSHITSFIHFILLYAFFICYYYWLQFIHNMYIQFFHYACMWAFRSEKLTVNVGKRKKSRSRYSGPIFIIWLFSLYTSSKERKHCYVDVESAFTTRRKRIIDAAKQQKNYSIVNKQINNNITNSNNNDK